MIILKSVLAILSLVFLPTVAPAATPAKSADGEFLVSQASNADVASNAAGRSVVVYSQSMGDGYEVFGKRFDATGRQDGGDFLISLEGDQRDGSGSVAMADDGSFVVTWVAQDGIYGDKEILMRRFDAAGLPLTEPLQVNQLADDWQERPDIGMRADGSFVVVWDSKTAMFHGYSGIVGRLFHPDASPASDEFVIGDELEGFFQSPAVAMAQDGSFVVAWHGTLFRVSGGLAMFRRFTAAGIPIGEWESASSEPDYSGSFTDVASDVDGNFIVVWAEDGRGYNQDIFGQRFDKLGRRVGDDFKINTFSYDRQWRPSITTLTDEGFLVAWESRGQDGSGEGVYGQRFNGDAVPEGSELRISESVTNDQFGVAVASVNGHYFAVWQSDQAGMYLYNVLGRRVPKIVRAEVDLTVSGRISPDVVEPDGTIHFDLVVTNLPGPDREPATEVAVKVNRPVGGEWRITEPAGWTCPFEPTTTCRLNRTLGPGEQVALNLESIVPYGPDRLTASVDVRSNEQDADLSNNTASMSATLAQRRASFARESSSVLEGSAASVAVELVLSRPGETEIVVPLQAEGWDAGAFGSLPTEVRFAPWETHKLVQIPLVNDELDEPNAELMLRIGNGTDFVAGSVSAHTLTLVDDDVLPAMGFDTDRLELNEDGEAVMIAVRISQPSTKPVTVSYTLGGTAVVGRDFTVTPANSIRFEPGVTVVHLRLTPLDDAVWKVDRTLTLTLVNPVNASAGGLMTLTVLLKEDDDRVVLDLQRKGGGAMSPWLLLSWLLLALALQRRPPV
jgi:hypothetical protein